MRENRVVAAGGEVLKVSDVTSATEETVQFDEAPKENDVISAAEETVQFDEAPKENDLISAAEETVQFDEAPKENDGISAADETVPFVKAPTENNVTTASQEKRQFDDDTVRGEKTTCCLLSLTKCRRWKMNKCTQLGLLHTNPDILETPYFFTRVRVEGALDLYEERFHREKVRFQ